MTPDQPQRPTGEPPVNTTTDIDVEMHIGAMAENATAKGVEIGELHGTLNVFLSGRRDEQAAHARLFLLERVRAIWVDGALQDMEQVHRRFAPGAGLIPLHYHRDDSLVTGRASATAQVAHLGKPAATAILDDIASLFTQTDHSLLILGGPGSGKTALLLQLARQTIDAAQRNPAGFVPVVLTLSTWSTHFARLDDWIVHELNTTKYGVPKVVSQRMLDENALLLLLDGLDAIDYEQRDDCVTAINRFLADHGGAPIALTCRTEEYVTLPLRLGLNDAVVLDDLSAAQIEEYFAGAGDTLGALHAALVRDEQLLRLLRSPLMLTIMSLTYADARPADLSAARAPTARTPGAAIFGAFVDRMFVYKIEGKKPFTDAQTRKWLQWLAQQMTEWNQSTFFIEQIQPSWLPSPSFQWGYMIASRTWLGLIGGLVGGLIIGLATGLVDGIRIGLVRGLVEGVIGGLVAGPILGVVDMLWITRIDRTRWLHRLSPLWQAIIKIITVSVIVGCCVAVLFWAFFGSIAWLGWTPTEWLSEGLSVGMVFGLSSALLFAFGPRGTRHKLEDDIQTVEHLNWSSTAARRWVIPAMATGLIAGALAGLISQGTTLVQPVLLRFGELNAVLVMGLLGLLFFGLIGAVFGGLSGTFVKIEKITPNQGLRLSLANALRIGAVLGLLFMAIAGLLGWLSAGAQGAAIFALYGIFVGLLAAFWYGGIFAIQHATVRLLLWIKGCTPRPRLYDDFLDYAAQRIFLRKLGGGYMFIHRYLQAYFSALEPE